jgi:hypothetical protein
MTSNDDAGGQAGASRRQDGGSRFKTQMREGGLEPPRPFGHQILNLARLPIPPLSLRFYCSVKSLFKVSVPLRLQPF